MDEELLHDISLLLMNETVHSGGGLGPNGMDALKRIMVKLDVTVAVSKTLYTQEAIECRLRELLDLPPAA
jgi:hypothetical protein